MTVATELAKTNQRLEYILCIEGVGWPTNDLHGALSGGFDGDLFVTADLNDWEYVGGVIVGGHWPGQLAINRYRNAPNDGEMGYGEGTSYVYTHPNGTSYTLPTLASSATSMETGGVTGFAYLMFVGSDKTRFTISGADIDDNKWIVPARYTNGAWTYDNNAGVFTAFTPNSNDAIVGKIFPHPTLGIASVLRLAPSENQLFVGNTRHAGLSLPGSISESLDPKTVKYKVGGLNIKIDDVDDWWLANYTPRKAGNATTLNTALNYKDVDVILADGTNFVENDTCWIGGRELVKLGSKSGAGPHTYTASTRGYLGTTRGSILRRPDANVYGYWASGTSTSTITPFWFNRRVALYAHVPGEAVANCKLLWYGRLRSITNKTGVGVSYELGCVGDFLDDVARIHKPRSWVVSGVTNYDIPPETFTFPGLAQALGVSYELSPGSLSRYMRIVFSEPNPTQEANDDNGAYSLAAAYQYRTEPGGTDGMVSGWDAGTPQALDDGTAGNNICASFVDIEGEIIQLLKLDDTLSSSNYKAILAEKYSLTSNRFIPDPNWIRGKRATFLADCIHDSHLLNRFQVNGRVTRHPIDILLMFLTSSDRELFRADVIAGSTTTVAEFTVGSVGAVNLWQDLALHCVEGPNKFEARTISSNTADDITVARAFSNAPALGEEYQVRNSIYDVLPIGWGLGVSGQRLNLSSFEQIRERYLPGEEVGRFVLGQKEVDIWKMLQDNILKPYGILLVFDRGTGKLSAKYLGQALGDGVIEDYTAITSADVMTDGLGDIQHTFHNPISTIKLQTRANESVPYPDIDMPKSQEFLSGPALIDGDKVTEFTLRSSEVEAAFREAEVGTLELKAMLDTESTAGPLLVRLYGLVGLYASPPPVWGCELDLALYLSLAVGDWVSITINSPAALVNSFTGARGWTSVPGRIINLSMSLEERPVCQATIELFFQAINGARVAPAATTTSKGNDANGDYFVVNTSDFTNDSTQKDSFYFTTGDRIELRDITGAVKEAEIIKGFGTAFTTGAASGTDGTRIYVEGTIASAIAAGDYVTFEPWSASATARMRLYSAYANATTELLPDSAAARQYA